MIFVWWRFLFDEPINVLRYNNISVIGLHQLFFLLLVFIFWMKSTTRTKNHLQLHGAHRAHRPYFICICTMRIYGHKCTHNTSMHQNLWIVCMQHICVQGQPLRNYRWEVIKMRFIWWYSVSSNLRWIHLTSDYTILLFFFCTDWISLSRLFKLFANFILEVRACIPLFFLLLIVVIWLGFSFVKAKRLKPSTKQLKL